MGFSKQLTKDLKVKLIAVSKRMEEGTGTSEVKSRSGRQKKNPSDRAACVPESQTISPCDTKDLADTGMVHHSTLHCCLHKQDLYGKVVRRKPYLPPHQNCEGRWSQSPKVCLRVRKE